MNIQHLEKEKVEKQIKELVYSINTCTDELKLVILKDILLKKQRKLIRLNKIAHYNMLQNNNVHIDNALDSIIEQQNDETDAYKKLLDENDKEYKKNIKWNNKVDPKYTTEVKNDFANNKLMDRMNSELAFRLNGRKSTVIKPYSQKYDDSSDDDSGNVDEIYDTDYVSINKFKNYGIPADNFSSRRLL
jgi:hypothetical protein